MTEARLNESKKEKDIMGILPKSENLVQFICGDIIKKDEQRVVVTVMELCNGGTLFDMLEKR
jgi:serine/threonine protein kinase